MLDADIAENDKENCVVNDLRISLLYRLNHGYCIDFCIISKKITKSMEKTADAMKIILQINWTKIKWLNTSAESKKNLKIKRKKMFPMTIHREKFRKYSPFDRIMEFH